MLLGRIMMAASVQHDVTAIMKVMYGTGTGSWGHFG